jgi:hypothetical protein
MPVAACKSVTAEAVTPEAVTETAAAMKAASSVKAAASHAHSRLRRCRRANRDER